MTTVAINHTNGTTKNLRGEADDGMLPPQRAPKPPNPLVLRKGFFPKRPAMDPSTERWVEQVKDLADVATAAVAASQDHRRLASDNHKHTIRGVVTHARETENEARRRVDHESRQLRQVTKQHDTVVAELTALLKARQAVQRKLHAVRKPLGDLHRRLQFRSAEAPAEEASCDESTRRLRIGANRLQHAVDTLDAEYGVADRVALSLQELVEALRRNASARERALAADAVFIDSSASQLAPVLHAADPNASAVASARRPQGTDASVALPPLPGSQSARGPPHPASSSTRQKPVGSALAGPASLGSVRQGVQLEADPSKSAALVTTATGHSAQVRQQLKKLSHAVDEAVATNTELVESSVRQTMQDTRALQAVLADRSALVEKELAAVSEQRAAALGELRRLRGPAEEAAAKLMERRSAVPTTSCPSGSHLKKKKAGGDPLTEVSLKENAALANAIQAQQTLLQSLDAQHAKLTQLRSELHAAYESKQRLLAVDARILAIGQTPRPSTIASSQTSTRSSARHSSRRADGGAGEVLQPAPPHGNGWRGV